MRHAKNTFKLGRTASHRRCMVANMLKELIHKGRIETTVGKAKAIKSKADKIISLAKKNTLASRRQAIGELMVRFNALTPKESRQVKEGNTSAYNVDREVIDILFSQLGPRFEGRQGGYTRIVRKQSRVGDNAPVCVIEYLPE